MVYGEEICVQTKGFSDIVDLTAEVSRIVSRSKAKAGIVAVTAIGSTASVTTIEFEPALVEDFRDKLEEIASRDEATRHSQTWGDDNGFAHLRASLMGPGVCLPVVGGRPLLGTWQQIVLVDHDNRPRDRRVHVQVVGE
ncbi:MAG TPA: secondary thiamine-phosphate synthase enzyme YjbQ [Verrucomicrobiae bacterium]|nr:secondary thiamine-phosphate synthase enzyme YjbQ [Verrucomicrobiae bacterium]